MPPLFPLTAAGSAGVREERELARPPAPQATSATSRLVGDHRGAAEVRGIDRSQGPAPPSRYRLAKDRLADLLAAATELGLTKPTTTAFWYSRPLPGTVEVFDRFVPTGTGAAKGQWYYRMCSDMPRQELGDGLGCAAGGPFDGSRRTIAISQGQDRAAVGCTRLSVDTVERALDAYELLRR